MASASDSFKSKRTLTVGGKTYTYFGLPEAAAAGLGDISRLPVSLKILLENLLRWEDGRTVAKKDIEALADWAKARRSDKEIAFRPARVLMQDLTGVPAVVDLAAMRQAMLDLGGDAKRINPLSPVDLVIDHSVMIDNYGTADAYKKNVVREYERNQERYSFLRWGQGAFDNFRVVPPGAGICHQVNLEYLSQVVFINEKLGQIYPDTLVGTDSHTTMVNGLAVLGWGVGGIEAEAAMLGQPMSMLLPEVIGFKLTGALREGTTATDLVLAVVQMLRKKGVVGKFVEFYGDGLDHLPLADRATISNMAPEYGATCGFFPVDDETLRYMRATGRDEAQVELVEAYAKAQGMWREAGAEPLFTDALELDMSTVEPSLAGPKRPQDRVLLSDAASAFEKVLPDVLGKANPDAAVAVEGMGHDLTHGDVVLAAITSCTNTSNPSVMIAAGLLARNAVAKGLSSKPWVKTSLAPGSKVVADYLAKAGLQDSLDKLGFNVVAFGCASCIGNSGPLNEAVTTAIDAGNLVATAVLSGNRNFEGRVHPYCKANYLASPPLVVAYALAGSLKKDLVKEPLGKDKDGKDVYLKDIWPSSKEIAETIEFSLQADMYRNRYGNVFEGDADWKKVKTSTGLTYEWNEDSTYARLPPYFVNMSKEPAPVSDIKGARMLARLGDSITTDHISPAGSIKADGPAGDYLKRHQVGVQDFNSFGARRGNHEVMMRGTFANIRLRNELAPGTEGGITRHMPDGKEMSIFEAAELYKKDGVPLVIFGGKEYGTGSSRDWAAKGTMLLGVRAVIVESFERIHRSNLVGMGLLPLVLPEGVTRDTLKLDGTETFDIVGIEKEITPGMTLPLTIHRADGSTDTVELKCRIDTLDEVDYYRHGGILQYVLRSMMAS